MAHLLQLLGKTTSRVHGSNFKITSHSWIGSCWTVGTGSREWLCWCQVGFDHCRCHPNLVDMSPQRNEESRLQWLFRSTLATLCDALWWVTQWCGPIFLQLHMPGRMYALLPPCQVLHYTSRCGMDPVLREAQQRWRLSVWKSFALYLAVRFGIGATSPSPSWDSQAGYLWDGIFWDQKKRRLILISWYFMLMTMQEHPS